MKKLAFLIVILTLTCVVSAQNSNSQKKSIKEVKEEPDTTAPFRFVEEMPEFPGGMEAMNDFIRQEIQYPQEAIDNNLEIQGTVLLECIIEKDGRITNVKPLVSLHPLFDAEAVRVVEKMPKWKPGSNMGKPVRCYFHIPIRFVLQ